MQLPSLSLTILPHTHTHLHNHCHHPCRLQPHSLRSHHLHLSRVQLGGHGGRHGKLDLPPRIRVCLSVHHLRLCGEQQQQQQQQQRVPPVTSAAERTNLESRGGQLQWNRLWKNCSKVLILDKNSPSVSKQRHLSLSRRSSGLWSSV